MCASSSIESSEYSMHVGPNGYPPFVIVKGDGANVKYSGIVIDLLDEFEAENPDFFRSYLLLTRKRANAKMQTGGIFDLMFNSPLFVSKQILHFYQFTLPLFSTKDVVITRSDQLIVYEKPEDLFGKTIGIIRGYSYGQFDRLMTEGKIKTFVLDNQAQAIGMLEKNRIDAFVGNVHQLPFHLRQLGLELSDFKLSEVPLYEFEFGFLVKKDKQELFNKLNEFIAEITADGSFDQLMRSYFDQGG